MRCLVLPLVLSCELALAQSSCSSHPSCFGIAVGDCCPNAQGVHLSCCPTGANQFPPPSPIGQSRPGQSPPPSASPLFSPASNRSAYPLGLIIVAVCCIGAVAAACCIGYVCRQRCNPGKPGWALYAVCCCGYFFRKWVRSLQVMKSVGFAAEPVTKGSPTWAALAAMLDTDRPEFLGSGRDVRESGWAHGSYDSLELAGAWVIHHRQRESSYKTELKNVSDDVKRVLAARRSSGHADGPPDVPTEVRKVLAEATRKLLPGPPSADANEAVLLHGVKADSASSRSVCPRSHFPPSMSFSHDRHARAHISHSSRFL